MNDKMVRTTEILLEVFTCKMVKSKSPQVVFFVDQDIRFAVFKNPALELFEKGVEHLFIAVRTNQKVSQPLRINLIKVEKGALGADSTDGMVLKEWVQAR